MDIKIRKLITLDLVWNSKSMKIHKQITLI